MGAAHSRSARERRERTQPRDAQDRATGPQSVPARRVREEDEGEGTPSVAHERELRRRRVASGSSNDIAPHLDSDEHMAVDAKSDEGASGSSSATTASAADAPRRPERSRLRAGWGRRTLDTLARRRPSTSRPSPDAPPSVASAETRPASPPAQPDSRSDPLAAERREAARLIEHVLGPRSARQHASTLQPHSSTAAAPHPSLDPSTLAGTFGPRASSLPRPGVGSSQGRERPTSAFGTLLSEVLGASRGTPDTGMRGAHDNATLSGTSVIVQGALVARTARHGEGDQGQQGREAEQVTTPVQSDSMPSASNRASASGRASTAQTSPDADIPHVATLEEQGEMLGRILRIAAAATAASVVSQTSRPTPAAFSPPSPPSPPPAPRPTENGESRRRSYDTGFGRELLNRLMSSRTASRRSSTPRIVPDEHEPYHDSETVSNISRLMRDALRASLPHQPPSPRSGEGSQGNSNETAASVLSTLERARQNEPLSEGEPGSFDRFLRELLDDLSAAIHRMNADGPSETNDESDSVRTRRDGDVVLGQLSFFRLHRFERARDSSLIPCVMVGVRSLREDERLMGSDQGMPRNGEENRPGLSRFVLFVSGGRYHEQHPLLVARPRDAGRDLMFMMELLGTIAAMSNKRPTASAADIERSGLHKIKASEIRKLYESGRVTENTLDKCLVCLDEWQDDDDCRVLSCKHAFHAACIDQWLEHSSNSCPLCTYRETNARPHGSCFVHSLVRCAMTPNLSCRTFS